jgi:acetylornithine/succinyldiaminopimelate/putrescine aminotransferase/predicted amino acid dehydrogenase
MLAHHGQDSKGESKASKGLQPARRGGSEFPAFAPKGDEYFRFVKPGLKNDLGLLGLDVTYHRGLGDRLYTSDHKGKEIEILDLVGGFGASFFGHNHPEILSVLERRIMDKQPMLTQGSNQAESGRLAARLSERLFRLTGKSYVCTFGNSGAEAVDIAMKHAELERILKINALQEETRRLFDRLEKSHRQGQEAFEEEELVRVGLCQRGMIPTTMEDTLRHIEEHNHRVLGRAPLYLAIEKGFHGKTIGSLSLTYNGDYRNPFKALLQPTQFLDPLDPERIERVFEASLQDYFTLITDETHEFRIEKRPISHIAALIAEPIQGEGGIRPLSRELLGECRRLCDHYDIPLIFDEIQSGMGRTGRFFASEYLGITGDIYTLGKSLGGGIAKISATLIDRDRYVDEFSLLHSSTFAEDSWSSAVGNRVLDLLEHDRLLMLAGEKGAYLEKRLSALAAKYPSAIKSVRGKGLMLGVVLSSQRDSGSPMIREIDKAGRLAHFACGYLFHQEKMRVFPTLSDSHVLRIEPSVFISSSDLDRVLNAFERLCEVLTKSNAHVLLKFVAGDLRPSEFPVKRYGRRQRKKGADTASRKVGFLAHLIDESQLSALEPSFGALSSGAKDRFIRNMMSVARPMPVSSVDITSASDGRINFNLIALPITSRHMAEYLENPEGSPALNMVKDGVGLAQDMGCEVVGLGQYTSIISNNGLAITEPNLSITTGSSFTVATTVRAAIKAARLRGLEPGTGSISVVGAAGNIGSAYATMIARHFWPINLVGSSRSGSLDRLVGVRAGIIADCYGVLAQKSPSAAGLGGVLNMMTQIPLVRRLIDEKRDEETAVQIIVSSGVMDDLISISTDISSIKTSQVIVAVSNSHEKVIGRDLLTRDAILCDVSVPCSTDPEVIKTRKDVLFFAGGIVKLPKGEDMGTPAFPLPAGHVFACMAETMLLGLSGIRDNLSYGDVRPESVRLIDKIAEHHGFELGPLTPHALSPMAALADQGIRNAPRENGEDKSARGSLWK